MFPDQYFTEIQRQPLLYYFLLSVPKVCNLIGKVGVMLLMPYGQKADRAKVGAKAVGRSSKHNGILRKSWER